MLDWIKRGLSASDGSMDDARINAGLLVLAFIGAAVYGITHVPVHTLAELGSFMKDFGIGAAALAGGVGAWFGLRKDN